mmetsp:Transcript_13197/g.20713  ORF Transcript_13197/g.20713 Transcript_13197/m.20713 type:complete len:565 (+) Transcript_13197:74-1768(+)
MMPVAYGVLGGIPGSTPALMGTSTPLLAAQPAIAQVAPVGPALPTALPGGVQTALSGTPFSITPSPPLVILHQCKHIDRTSERAQCSAPLHLREHKRGHLAVACEANHQWVWCPECCDCGLGTRGCIMPAHWMERDSFDTGKRNHMQRHQNPQPGGPGAKRPAVNHREDRLASKKAALARLHGSGIDKGSTSFLTMVTQNPKSEDGQSSALVTTLSQAPQTTHIYQPGMIAATPNGQLVHIPPAPVAVAATPQPFAEVRQLRSDEVIVLDKCKHVDRKGSKALCSEPVKTRNHKRGYLAVTCEYGHQWVWCSYCCSCKRQGIGCSNPNHWMERDSFDTGRRNHMQRHLENYDADNDEEVGLLANPQVAAMPALAVPCLPAHAHVAHPGTLSLAGLAAPPTAAAAAAAMDQASLQSALVSQQIAAQAAAASHYLQGAAAMARYIRVAEDCGGSSSNSGTHSVVSNMDSEGKTVTVNLSASVQVAAMKDGEEKRSDSGVAMSAFSRVVSSHDSDRFMNQLIKPLNHAASQFSCEGSNVNSSYYCSSPRCISSNIHTESTHSQTPID